MKVFVSWSGELSRQVAQVLRTWLPRLIQSLDVFYSPDDIEKGENWDTKISQELSSCNYGIVCLTSENTTAPWIHFEAGALAKTLESRVCALMVNINPSDIKGPLSRYQATRLDRDDFYQLIESINKALETPLDTTVLEPLFDALWPTILEEFETAKKQFSTSAKKKDDKAAANAPIEEILQLLRKQNALLSNPEELLPPGYFEYLKKEVLGNTQVADSAILSNFLHYCRSIIDAMEKCFGEMDLTILDAIHFDELFALLDAYISRKPRSRTMQRYRIELMDLREHYSYIMRRQQANSTAALEHQAN